MEPGYGAPQQPRAGLPAWAFCIIIPCGCIILGIPILAAILVPVFAQAREKARQISCLSNIKQQATGVLMYCQDYDEKLPAAKDWMVSIDPYVKNDSDYHCPTAQAKDSAAFGYAYSSLLSNKNVEKIAAPQTTIMNYDSSTLTKNASDAVSSLPNPPRHSQRNNIGYVDGHAKSRGSGSASSGQ